MYQSLDMFQTASAMARHAGSRQAVVARNIANADTPGFQAQYMAAFQDVYRADNPTTMRATRPGHLAGTTARSGPAVLTASGTPSPNGNTVSLEDELLQSVAIGREHNRALTIYRHTMTVLRNSLGRN